MPLMLLQGLVLYYFVYCANISKTYHEGTIKMTSASKYELLNWPVSISLQIFERNLNFSFVPIIFLMNV